MVNNDAYDKTPKHRMCLIQANAFANSELLGANGAALGTVVDFVIDVGTGVVAYVLVACGGFMGIGEERYALPWAWVRPQQGEGGWHWQCATATLPAQYRLDSAHALSAPASHS